MLPHPRGRFLAVAVLVVVLAALFVTAGAIEPDPADNNYPDTADIQKSPAQYVGEQVAVGGTVTDTDPLTIETVDADERLTFVVENADPDVAVGDELRAFGTLRGDNHVEATNTIDREPWEAQYMYVVSFLAGLLVLARLVNGWTIDTATLSVVPRTDPLVTIHD